MISDDIFTNDDVKRHDKVDDAWVIMDGSVFDITPFIRDHPGGSDIVMDHLGKEISSVFMDQDIHDHSESAYNIIQRYRIGSIREYHKTTPSVSEILRSREKLKQLNSLEDLNIDSNGNGGGGGKGGNAKNRISDQELQKMIDVKKAILPQLVKLEGDNYLRWIHSQTGLNQIIIFDSFLEMFTRWPWWYIFVLWIPVISYAFIKSTLQPHSSVIFSAIVFSFGLFFWSFVEYILHRFVFHIKTSSYWGNFFHFFIHGIHHLTPFDSTRLTFPPMFSVVLAVSIWNLFKQFSPTLIENGFNLALYSGVACGYMLYDTVHYYFHHGDFPWLPAKLKELKTNHLNHHYKDDSKNFGITSTVFDVLFGTY